MFIYLVVGEEPDSPSGYDISGVFITRKGAVAWAKSEGNGQKVIETIPGPIPWNTIDRAFGKGKGFWE